MLRSLSCLLVLALSAPALAGTIEVGGMGVEADIPDGWEKRATDDESQYYVSPKKTSRVRFFAVEAGGGLIAKMLLAQMKKDDDDGQLFGPVKVETGGLKSKRWTAGWWDGQTPVNATLTQTKVPGMGTILTYAQVAEVEGVEDGSEVEAILGSLRDKF